MTTYAPLTVVLPGRAGSTIYNQMKLPSLRLTCLNRNSFVLNNACRQRARGLANVRERTLSTATIIDATASRGFGNIMFKFEKKIQLMTGY